MSIINIAQGNPFSGYGIHTTNRYDISFNFPVAVANKISENMGISISVANQRISETCTNINTPTGNISTTQIKNGGDILNIPYEKIYEQCIMTFYMDWGGIVHGIFSNWLECVFDTRTKTFGYHSDYSANSVDISFTKRESSAEPFKIIRLVDCYPTAISPIPLSGLSGGNATQFDVTVVYRHSIVDNMGQSLWA